MPHIQIKNTEQQRQWLNTDCIETVTDTMASPMEVSIMMRDGGEVMLRGKEALHFLDAYQRLCVAQQRPEVG